MISWHERVPNDCPCPPRNARKSLRRPSVKFPSSVPNISAKGEIFSVNSSSDRLTSLTPSFSKCSRQLLRTLMQTVTPSFIASTPPSPAPIFHQPFDLSAIFKNHALSTCCVLFTIASLSAPHKAP